MNVCEGAEKEKCHYADFLKTIFFCALLSDSSFLHHFNVNIQFTSMSAWSYSSTGKLHASMCENN